MLGDLLLNLILGNATISDFYELELLKKLKNEATIAVQLHKGNPGEACTSNVSATTARKLITFAEPSAGAMASTNPQLWTGVTATEKINNISLWNNATAGAGNPFWYGPLETEKEIIEGENFEFPTGEVIVSLD